MREVLSRRAFLCFHQKLYFDLVFLHRDNRKGQDGCADAKGGRIVEYVVSYTGVNAVFRSVRTRFWITLAGIAALRSRFGRRRRCAGLIFCRGLAVGRVLFGILGALRRGVATVLTVLDVVIRCVQRFGIRNDETVLGIAGDFDIIQDAFEQNLRMIRFFFSVLLRLPERYRRTRCRFHTPHPDFRTCLSSRSYRSESAY